MFLRDCASLASKSDRLTVHEAHGTESENDRYRGIDKVMRERQRVETLRDQLAAQRFLSSIDLPEMRVTVAE